jgi:hypothetical protein
MKTPLKIVALSSSLLTERMILYSSFLDALQPKVELHYWTTSERNLNYDAGADGRNLQIEKFPEIKPFKEIPYNYLRRLNEYAWDYKLRPPSRLSMDRLVKKDAVRMRIRALKLPARAISLLNQHERFEDWLEGVLLGYQRSPEALRRFTENRPDAILTTGTFRYEEPAIAAAARSLGIPLLAFITSWDNITTKNRMVFKYDGYIVWSERMKQELHEYYPYTREAPCYMTGAPQFDVFFQTRFHQSRAEFCARYGLEEDRPIILYAPGTPNMFTEDRAILHLAGQVVSGAFGDAQMLVRPHPLHDDGKLDEMLRDFAPRVAVQRSGQAGLKVAHRSQDETLILEWVNAFRHAEVVVNLSSTAAIDGAIFDHPVVNLNFDPEPDGRRLQLIKELNHVWSHFKPVAESGGLWMANDLDEMVVAVKTYLKHPELHREHRQRMAEFVCGRIDGRCGERMAEALLDFARKHDQRRDISDQ